MTKKSVRIPALCAFICAAIALSGCLRFENSFDLTTTARVPGTQYQGDASAPGQYDPNTTADPVSGTYADPGVIVTDSAGNPVNTTSPTVSGGNEVTTVGGGSEATTAGGASQTPAQYVQSLGANEYDTLRSNALTLDAVVGDGTEENPLQMALGNGDVYIKSEMDGLEMGIFISDNKTYIYLPSQKKYLKLSSAVAKLIGIDPNEFSDMTKDLGFDSLPPLSQAQSMTDGAMRGQACKLFLLKSIDGTETLRVGLAGKKLVGIEYLDNAGNMKSYMYFNSITPGFPKMPPDGYTEMGYMEFFKLVMAEME